MGKASIAEFAVKSNILDLDVVTPGKFDSAGAAEVDPEVPGLRAALEWDHIWVKM